MFEIGNRTQLWFWTVIIVCLAMAFAAVAVFVVFPLPLAQEVWLRAMVIVLIVASPIVRFVLGIMYSNHQISEDLRRLVERDRLTDVATRDFFFSKMMDHQETYGVSLMIDIDHFKEINDEHGHLVGDEVIKNVALALCSEIRESDIVCRFGGEEFVVFLHQSNEDLGWGIAERMRKAVADLSTSGKAGEIQVTVSVGGSMKKSLEVIEDAIRRADACLYRAKNAGRNRTITDWNAPRIEDRRVAT